jgi:hypothetical protein
MISTVTILFCPPMLMMNMYRYRGEAAIPFVKDALKDGRYTEKSPEFMVDGAGESAADEAFDLTNNPSRQDERELVYGKGRSLSVGDIVDTGKEKFVCMSFGWEKL